jgi:hypothetical protein
VRKLVVIMLALLLVPAAAYARGIDKGDGTLAVKNANGTVQITTGKGSILGKVEDGTLTIIDGNPFDGNDPQVLGADGPVIERNLSTTVYRGQGMRFRIVGGRYTIKVVGTGIGLAAVGTGRVKIVGQGSPDDGQFAVDGSPFKVISLAPYVGAFGQVPAPIPAAG